MVAGCPGRRGPAGMAGAEGGGGGSAEAGPPAASRLSQPRRRSWSPARARTCRPGGPSVSHRRRGVARGHVREGRRRFSRRWSRAWGSVRVRAELFARPRQMLAGLRPCPEADPTQIKVLLAQPPSSRLHAGVWRVVCLAFVCALDHVRRASCAIALAGVPSVLPSTPDTSVPFMINRAVARFWDLLTDFCVLNAAPDSW